MSELNFDEYQKLASSTAIYPNKNSTLGLMYCALGLSGETGEVAECVKKLYRDYNGIVTEDIKKNITKEMGDVLWYLAGIARELDISFNEVAQTNIDKLFYRKERNVLHGNGDNR